MGKKIVFKVEPGMDIQDILCTTYQMRNFYNQFKEGFFSNLDIMNYIQHYVAAKMAKNGWNIVDVCCGRSLMLPLLRYHAKNIASYIGVDISAANIREAMHGASKKLTAEELKTYYPFKVGWKQCNVAEMTKVIPVESTDFVIYTSAVEHMYKDVGLQSLKECYKIMKKGAVMFLSCPNTPGNGYNTQYAAHVYEWGYDELKETLRELNFTIENEVGLVMGVKEMKDFYSKMPDNSLKQFYNALSKYMPSDWMSAIMSIPFPKASKEILFIVRK